MAFLLYLLSGVAGGVLGGMGMGGGTALIPLLTLLCGMEQTAAQGVNLLSFLPLSLAALPAHRRNGLLRCGPLPYLIPSALCCSVLFSLAAAYLPAAALRHGFGVFLTVLSLFQFRAALTEGRARRPRGS